MSVPDPASEPRKPSLHPHEQMLKLVAKGFYRELINYGVKEAEIVTVAGHLLDNLMLKESPAARPEAAYSRLFRVGDVLDTWPEQRRLRLHDVSLTPLTAERVPAIAAWLDVPKIRNSFYPRFPRSAELLARYFEAEDCEYFAIEYGERFVGIIGAEHIDLAASKLEMRKLVGDPEHRGKGIGKRATFLFLYYVFVVRRCYKVYLHTLDINIRNLNLNGNFGFWLEGVFFEDVTVDGQRQDLVRMALTAPAWERLFR